MSAIISSQIADTEDTRVDLDDDNIELRIGIEEVFSCSFIATSSHIGCFFS